MCEGPWHRLTYDLVTHRPTSTGVREVATGVDLPVTGHVDAPRILSAPKVHISIVQREAVASAFSAFAAPGTVRTAGMLLWTIVPELVGARPFGVIDDWRAPVLRVPCKCAFGLPLWAFPCFALSGCARVLCPTS